MTEPSAYQIRVQGWIADRWAGWFAGMAMTTAQAGASGAPITTLTGIMPDQAALRGVLNKIWDLNLMLISVAPLDDLDEEKGDSDG